MTRLLDPATVAPVRWHNGAGMTRVLASDYQANGGLLWRISLADLDRSATFSPFPGVSRLFVPLGPLRLTIGGETVTCEPGDRLRFAGEAPVQATIARATQALNVMTARGRYRADVALRRSDSATPVSASVVASVLLGDRVADVRLVPIGRDLHG